jgi:hypothetical protein
LPVEHAVADAVAVAVAIFCDRAVAFAIEAACKRQQGGNNMQQLVTSEDLRVSPRS